MSCGGARCLTPFPRVEISTSRHPPSSSTFLPAISHHFSLSLDGQTDSVKKNGICLSVINLFSQKEQNSSVRRHPDRCSLARTTLVQ